VAPIRLAKLARAGSNYSLPSVNVANTGTQAESVSVRVERLSRGNGRKVPPSWVHAGQSLIRLSPNQQANIPLQLSVPVGAKPGRYLSDIVVVASAVIPVGSTNFGAAAATKLEFRVGEARPAGSFPALWAWWALATAILVVFGGLAARRSGLRIRIERTNARSSHG
jgi:hypothetical protein